MAFTNANLSLRGGAAGDNSYVYETTDTMKTVATAGYFHNITYLTNLVAGDYVYCQCTDGNMWQRVLSVSSGSVTTVFAGGNLPINTAATATAAEFGAALVMGFLEVGTSIATATRYILPVPYVGGEFRARRIDSGTQSIEFDAGGSAGTHWDASATAIVYDSVGNRRITTRVEGEWFHVVASGARRWRVYGQHFFSSGSEDLGGGASVAISAT